MLRRLRRCFIIVTMSLALIVPNVADADIFGADVAVLTQILMNAFLQLYQLKEIFSNGADSLDLLRDINSGIRDGLRVIQIINPQFSPGLYGNLQTPDQVLAAIHDLYGTVPRTGEAIRSAIPSAMRRIA